MIEIELELISDTDMYLFVEKGMRGDISNIAKKYNKANNKYINVYDNSKLSKCIMYLDANNLYGWVRSQYLRYNEFKWLNQKEIEIFDGNLISENNSHGYILKFDFEYLDELH